MERLVFQLNAQSGKPKLYVEIKYSDDETLSNSTTYTLDLLTTNTFDFMLKGKWFQIIIDILQEQTNLEAYILDAIEVWYVPPLRLNTTRVSGL